MYNDVERVQERERNDDGPVGSRPDQRGNPEPPCCTLGDVMVVAAMTVRLSMVTFLQAGGPSQAGWER